MWKGGYYAGNRKEIPGLGAGTTDTGNYGKKEKGIPIISISGHPGVSPEEIPQPVDTYIGIITPEGVIKSGRKKYPWAGSK